MALRISFLLFFILLFNVIQGQQCQTDKGCNRDIVKCGFCVEGYCQFPFINIYTPGSLCSFKTNKCKKEICTSGQIKSAPIEGYSSCVCECSTGRYGQYCEKEGESGVTYTSGIQLIAPTVVRCMEDYRMFVTVQDQGTDVNKSPLNIKLLLTTTSGVFGAIFTVPTLIKVTTEKAVAFCKHRSWDPSICQYFRFNDANGMNMVFEIPLKLPFWYPRNWRWSNVTELSMSGLTHTLLMKIASEGLELSTIQQQLVVFYNIGLHQSEIPVPKIYNCGNNIETPALFNVNQEIDLTSVMFFTTEDKFYLSIKLIEKSSVQRIIYFEWLAFRVELNSQTLQPEYNYFGKSYWRVSQFSWRHGLYIVRLKTQAIDRVRTDNYGQCYLKVKLEPLVATISGGSQKIVNIEEELVLDPSGSRDPNQPLGESKLIFTMTCNWTTEAVCQQVCRESFFYDGGSIQASKPTFRYGPRFYNLEVGKVYNFTLKVELKDMNYKLEPAYARQLVTVQHFPLEIPLKSFVIECFYNCDIEVNPQDIIYLKLKGSWKLLKSLSDLKWTIFGREGEVKKDLYYDEAYQHIFIVPENLLEESSAYQIKVCLQNTDLLATYELTTSMSPKAQCRVEPSAGFKLQTMFKISCNSTGFVEDFEFYDRSNQDVGNFGGRMLAFQKTGEIEDEVLCGGTLEVYTFGKNRIKSIVQIPVHLKKGNKAIIRRMNYYWRKEEMTGGVSIIEVRRKSATLETLKPREGRSYLLGMLLRLNMVPYKTGSDAKLLTWTLHDILATVYRKYNYKLSFREAFQVAITLDAISRTLTRESAVHKGTILFTFDEYNRIFSYLLDCIYIVFETGWNDVHGPVEHAELRFSSQVEAIHKRVLDTFRRIGMILLSNHFPGQLPARIKSNEGKEDTEKIFISAQVDFPREDMFANMWPINHYPNAFFIGSGPVVLPKELKDTLNQMGHLVGLQVSLMRKNRAVWWQREIETDIVHVQMCYRPQVEDECRYPQWLESPIWVNFYIRVLVEKVQVHIENVTRLNELKPQDVLDLEMKVFKIDLPPGACLSVYFNLTTKDDELIVLIEKGIRPGYHSVERKGKVISQKKDVYYVKCETHDQPEFYYMAILAGDRVLLHHTLSFGYKALYQLCLSWNGKLRKWESEGSSVLVLKLGIGPKTKLICQWTRLSVFAAEVREPTVKVDQVQDMILYFTPWSNRTSGLKYLLLFTLAFVLGFILVWWTDRYQRVKRFVKILPDNFPREKNGYLVCVMTGTHIYSGTDANVGIRIYGTDGESRAHILKSCEHDVLGWNSEDWFILFTPRHLGTLETLQIWHDNTGSSPAWFCDSILVFDMKKENYYIFSVNQWINLSVTNIPEAFVKPLQLTALTTWYRIFMNNLKCGFRQRHLWMATVFRHPRDPIKRTDRLIIIFCFILVSMSTSLFLVIFSERGQHLEDKEDPPSYSINWNDIIISFFTFTVSTAVAGLIMFMVRKSYAVCYCSKEEDAIRIDSLLCRSAQYVMLKKDYILSSNNLTYLSYHSSNLFDAKSSSYKQFMALQFMQNPLIPVQLLEDKSAVQENWDWRCRTVLFCILIVLKSAIVCVLLSEHLSPNHIKRWFTVATITIILHIVIYLPLKILIISLVLSFNFGRIIYKDFYIFDPMDCRQKYLYGNVQHLSKIISERMKPKYQPIQESTHEAHQLKRLRLLKWKKILDFLFLFMFIIVLSKFLSKDNLLKYFSNSHLRSLINASRDDCPNYRAIYNLKQFDHFLQEPFSLSLFKYMWYNMKPLQEGGTKSYRKDWCYDNTHRMLGRPRFRQFRVKPGYCQAPLVMENESGILDCAATWGSSAAEDTQVYKPYWIHPENLNNNTYWSLQFNHSDWSREFTTNWSYSVNWSYTNQIDFTYYGSLGNSYPPGGYNRSLWGEVRVELSVQDNGWVEHHTRAVLAQVTLYNVNTRYLTQVTLVTERTVSGQFIATIVVQSVDTIFEVDIWMVLLIVFTLLHFVRITLITNIVGLVGYFKKGYRLCELLELVFILISITNFAQHYFMVEFCEDQYQIDVKEENQFQFYEKSSHILFARLMLCVVFLLAVIQVYISHLWRFGQHFLNFFHTIILSFKAVIWLVIIFVLFLTISWSLIYYLISVFVAVVLNLKLAWKFTFAMNSEREQFVRLQILCFMVCFGSVITSALMLVIFTYEYKEAKKYIVNDKSIVNLVTFVIQDIGCFYKLENATELRKKDELSINIFIPKEENLSIPKEENLSLSENNKQNDLKPEEKVTIEQQSRIYSLLPF